jgi:uncharacterized MAPEG superfamily protein
MALVTLVIALALLEYFVFAMLVGRARLKYDVQAPATSGHPTFDRTYRVQQNTLEQLVVFIPCMWIFGTHVSAPIAAGLGCVFIVGRVIYLRAYVADPASRSLGFAVGALAQIVLLLGAVVGSVLAVLA